MNAASLCQRNAITIRPSDEVTAAAQSMREHHVGYLVVVDRDPEDGSMKPVGVLTDRDIVVTVVARATDPRTLRVGDIMTQNLVVVDESDPIEGALQAMRQIGVRRLPVVGNRGHLIGVLSFDDVQDEIAGELQTLAGSIRNERRIENMLRP